MRLPLGVFLYIPFPYLFIISFVAGMRLRNCQANLPQLTCSGNRLENGRALDLDEDKFSFPESIPLLKRSKIDY